MDALREFLEEVKRQQFAQRNLLGLLQILIGRRIARSDGTLISTGLTWRDLAAWLKKAHWDTDSVIELGLKFDDLPVRDRQRYWYTAIARAGVDSPLALQAGEKLADLLRQQGYVISSPKK